MQCALDKEDSTPKLIIAPRDHGKSSLITVGETLYRILTRRASFAVAGSATEDRAVQFVRLIKAEFEENAVLKKDFGIRRGNPWSNKELILKNPSAKILARGRNSPWRGLLWRGHRPDFVVIDDLEQRENIRNPRRVKERLNWLISEVYPAVSLGGTLIVIGNLFSRRSAIAILYKDTEKYPFERFRFDAEDEDGNPVWSERFTKEDLLKKRRIMGEALYRAEMLNCPYDEEGALVREESIRYYEPAEIEGKKLTVSGFFDPSATANERSDYKAFITVGDLDGVKYVLDAWIRRATMGEALKAIYERYLKFRHVRIGVESNLFEEFFRIEAERLRARLGVGLPWSSVHHGQSKELRLLRIAPQIENGDWLFLKNQGDQKLLIEQLLFFGSPGVKDDGPDALAGCDEMITAVNNLRIRWT